MKITNPEEIVAYYNANIGWKGHFEVEMPDGTSDDYDNSVPDFAVKQKWGGEPQCEDSNGSDPNECLLIDGKAKFVISVADREYITGGKTIQFAEMEVQCTIKEIDTDDFDSVVVEEVKILSIDGKGETE